MLHRLRRPKLMVQSNQLEQSNEPSQRVDVSIVVTTLERLMDAALTAGLSRSSPAYEAAAVIVASAAFTRSEVNSTQILDDLRRIDDVLEDYDYARSKNGKKEYRETSEAWARLRALVTGAAHVDPQATRIADAMEACDWSGCSIGNKEMLKAAVLHLRANVSPTPVERDETFNVDELAQEIRRVDGAHSLGAGALAEALMPFLERAKKRNTAAASN